MTGLVVPSAGAIAALRPLGRRRRADHRRLLGRPPAAEPRADDPARLRPARPRRQLPRPAARRRRDGQATRRSGSCSTRRSRSWTRTSTSGSRPPAGSWGAAATRSSRRRPTPPSSSSQHAQRPDGYLNTFVQVLEPGGEYADLRWGHELYCYGHLIQAAVAWQRALGDDRLLEVAPARRRVRPARARVRTGARTIDGHPEIEMALVELYRVDRRPPPPRARGRVHRPARARDCSARTGSGPPTGRITRRSARRRPSPATPCGSSTSTAARSTSPPSSATGSCSTRSAGRWRRHGRDPVLPDRRRRQPASRRGVRRPVRAAAGPGLHRVVRGDRERDARLAPAARDRRPRLRRRHRADDDSTASSPGSASTGPRSSTSTRSSGGPSASPPTAGHGRAPGVVRVRLLPAEPDADAQLVAAAPGDDRRRGHPAPPVRAGRGVGDRGAAARSAWRSRPGTRGTGGSASRCSRRRTRRGRCRCGGPHGRTTRRWRGPTADGDAGSRGARRLTRTAVWRAGDRVVLDLPMQPRLTVPDPRIDAVRGSVAIERGPVVYCVETADLPAGVELEDVASTRGGRAGGARPRRPRRRAWSG